MAVFSPKTTVIVSASATSVAISLDSGQSIIRTYNAGPSKAFVRWGTGTQSAVVTDMPLAVEGVEAFDKGIANNFAAICSGTETAILYITVGSGE